MSSSDRLSPPSPRRFTGAAVVGLAMFAAACTTQPLYGPTAGGGRVPASLSQISIEEVDTRVAQQVRNQLLFDLNSRATVSPAYYMHLTVSTAESPLGVTPVESAPAYSVTVTTTYTIRAFDSDDVILRETVRATASYDRVNQIYANVRGRRDAENRAAITAANDIRIRLSAAAARGIL